MKIEKGRDAIERINEEMYTQWEIETKYLCKQIYMSVVTVFHLSFSFGDQDLRIKTNTGKFILSEIR